MVRNPLLGPMADTGGLMQHHSLTVSAYTSLEALLEGESRGAQR